ncbi:MAG TPA: MmgE/PrpD family protein [Candidatus Dormibacteraeota bacterium]|nr:MmgE/PrpD family protein [Candidatus Dormibacteraeota bacterium]
MSASRALVRWGLGLRLGDIPAGVRRTACRHVLDALGCGLGARRLGEAEPALRVAAGLGGSRQATLIGGGRVAAPNAALGNGALIHALDFDDTHADGLVHMTAAVLPAALAAAEEQGASGAELLTALVAGFEVVTRLGAAIRHAFHARGFHATSVCGTFASALAAGRLYGLREDAAVHALGVAGSFAAGSLEFLADGSSTKQLHPGWAAHAGLVAARLAAAGASGPETVLEGESGLYRAYAGQAVQPEMLVRGLGETWETARTTIKPYPACQLSHASLDALREAAVPAADVAGVHFRVPEEAAAIVLRPEPAKLHPRTPYDAKFSLQWCAAALLVDGELGIESFARDRVERPEVFELARRVSYEVYDPKTAAAAAGGHVEVTRRDGSARTGEVSSSRGGPENPLPDDQVLAKFRLNAGPGLGSLADAVLHLESVPAVRDLTARLGEPAGAIR